MLCARGDKYFFRKKKTRYVIFRGVCKHSKKSYVICPVFAEK